MNNYKSYIKDDFPNELKLLIYLTQDELIPNELFDLSSINWDFFLELVLKHRLTSHVLKHASFLAEHFPIPVYEKLIDVRLEHSKKALSFAIHTIRIHEKFRETNISHCFFKGALLSLELYKDVGYRNFRDIDVLIEKENIERSKEIIEELGFSCIYPKMYLSKKQKKVNYKISHHYHFVHPIQNIHVELHWSMTNPESFLGISSDEIISKLSTISVSNYQIPYISKIESLVYLAAHGSIHQWYRLFWLKDFSRLISQTSNNDLLSAYNLAISLKLARAFVQACFLSTIFYHTRRLDFMQSNIDKVLLNTAIHSISTTDLTQKGFIGKLKFINYRIKLKPSFKYYFDLIYRLRTHLTDWELLKLNEHFFFLYYVLRPFLLLYKFFLRNPKL